MWRGLCRVVLTFIRYETNGVGSMNITLPVAHISPDELRAAVATRYGAVATTPDGDFNFPVGRAFAEAVGYLATALDSLPPGASASVAGVGHLLA